MEQLFRGKGQSWLTCSTEFKINFFYFRELFNTQELCKQINGANFKSS